MIDKAKQPIAPKTIRGRKTTKAGQSIAASFLISLTCLIVGEQPTLAAQTFSCLGKMDNGWGYTAEFVNGRFTQIRWERSGQPPQTSSLSFVNTNAQRQPVYTGAFQSATKVTLVDLSGGNVQTGSSISVTVEEWGTSSGTCGTFGSGNNPPSPPPTAQQIACTGKMRNGWAYTAEFANGRFTQIRWERSGQPPQISTLTSQGRNAQGQPVYRGAFQAATAVTLVDLSKGRVRPGSQVSVGAEEWGWARGNCRPGR